MKFNFSILTCRMNSVDAVKLIPPSCLPAQIWLQLERSCLFLMAKLAYGIFPVQLDHTLVWLDIPRKYERWKYERMVLFC